MSTVLASLLVNLGVDAKSFRSELYLAEKNLTKFASSAKSLGDKLSIGLTLPMVAVGAHAIKMAMNAVESENLVSEAFKGMTSQAEQWSKGMSEAYGLNEYELRKNAAQMHVMLQSMGLTEAQAYKMATSIVELSKDMESFYNMSGEEAFASLRAGLAGEGDSLKKLGILVNEATVKDAAYANGIAKVGAELTAQEKVMARYAVIVKATATAQGDLGRTIDSPANQMRVLKEQFNQAAIELGVAMLPTLRELMLMLKGVAGTIRETITWFNGLSDGTKSFVLNAAILVAALGPVIRVVGGVSGTMAVFYKIIRQSIGSLAGLNQAVVFSAASVQQMLQPLSRVQLAMASVSKFAKEASVALAKLGGPGAIAITAASAATYIAANELERFYSKTKDAFDVYKSNPDLFTQHAEKLNKMAESIGLTGEQWRVSTEFSKENYDALRRMAGEMKAMQQVNRETAAEELAKAAALERSKVAMEKAATAEKRLLADTASAYLIKNAALKTVAAATLDYYGIVTKTDIETKMKNMAADFALMAKEGVNIDEVMQKFAPQVAELADAAKKYQDLDVPKSFLDLADAVKFGGKYGVDALAQDLAKSIPDAAAQAKVALDATFGADMRDQIGRIKNDSEDLYNVLKKISEGKFEGKVKVFADTSELKRSLEALGFNADIPDTSGKVPT